MGSHTYLSTLLHHRIKEYSQSIPREPQCLRYEINELVAQFLTLREVSQEGLFKARNVLLFMPLKRHQSERRKISQGHCTLT